MFWQPLTVLQRTLGHKHCCWQPCPYFGNLHCSSQYFPVKPAGQTAAKICQYNLTNKFIFQLILRIHFQKDISSKIKNQKLFLIQIIS